MLTGVARPMREPGIEHHAPGPARSDSGVVDCCIPAWIENPERIMIDSDGLAGALPIVVTSNVTLVERHRAARLHFQRLQGAARGAAVGERRT